MPRPRSKKIDELALAFAKCSIFGKVGHGNWATIAGTMTADQFAERQEYFRAAAARTLRRLNELGD